MPMFGIDPSGIEILDVKAPIDSTEKIRALRDFIWLSIDRGINIRIGDPFRPQRSSASLRPASGNYRIRNLLHALPRSRGARRRAAGTVSEDRPGRPYSDR